MEAKKIIVCDLDGTLAESKSTISSEMAEAICRVLSRHYFAVISGGAFPQFQKQFLSELGCGKEQLRNLYLFPAQGSTCYVFDEEKNDWKQIYNEELSMEERKKIIDSFNEAIQEAELDLSGAYGEVLEDRGSQVTFSGRGQEAPLDVKTAWDPDQSKRRRLLEILEKKIPEFEVRIGGISSIDVTRVGVNKAYAIEKIEKLLRLNDEDIIFLGDALFSGGNDAAVKITGVDFRQVSGPRETISILEEYV